MNCKKLLTLAMMMLATLGCRAQQTKVCLETSMGDITIELFDDTPIHRDNFIKLVEEHFYDSLLFHRVISDFMIQAGDPTSRHAEADASLGDGDTNYTLEAEFRVPQHYHRRGAVAMAREGDRENPERRSSGCQFYIVWGRTFSPLGLEKVQERLDTMTGGQTKITEEMSETYRLYGGTPHLDGQYTVFGQVTEGLDVVDRIQQVETNEEDRPLNDVRILRATVVKNQ
ncbi:MAG: peptidylprolyl isomerase [Prevotella sp.]|nr:peptidylprolyl isomerase [Prevotella sp.]